MARRTIQIPEMSLRLHRSFLAMSASNGFCIGHSRANIQYSKHKVSPFLLTISDMEDGFDLIRIHIDAVYRRDDDLPRLSSFIFSTLISGKSMELILRRVSAEP